MNATYKIAVVIPCYRVKNQILAVISQIGAEVDLIYVVDDYCPESTGTYVQRECKDSRVRVIFHKRNKGVGGAVISGYRQALADAASIVVKIDGDGQMDPNLIPKFIKPIINGTADYVKGNRFFDLFFLNTMPKIRIFGNVVLSFISKISSGYWDIMDPTNGYTAIHASVLKIIPLHKIDNRYFFESEMLFRLSTVRAVVYDLPMQAKYGNEVSSLRIKKIVIEFLCKYTSCFMKRIFYNYFLRGFNIGSIELIVAVILIMSGIIYGILSWYKSAISGMAATSGTVMLASLPIILGFQSLIAAINYDVMSLPKKPLHIYFDN